MKGGHWNNPEAGKAPNPLSTLKEYLLMAWTVWDSVLLYIRGLALMRQFTVKTATSRLGDPTITQCMPSLTSAARILDGDIFPVANVGTVYPGFACFAKTILSPEWDEEGEHVCFETYSYVRRI